MSTPITRQPGAYVGLPHYAGGLHGGGLAVASGGGGGNPIFGGTSTDFASFSTQWVQSVDSITGIQNGDLVLIGLCYVANGGVASTVTSNGGTMTRVGTVVGPFGSTYFEVWAGTYTGGAFIFDFSVEALGGVTAVAGRNVSLGPNSGGGGQTNGSTGQATSFNTTVANSWVVGFTGADNGNSSRNWNDPQTGYTTFYKVNGGTGTRVQSIVAGKRQASTGATGFVTFEASGLCNRFIKSFELIPA